VINIVATNASAVVYTGLYEYIYTVYGISEKRYLVASKSYLRTDLPREEGGRTLTFNSLYGIRFLYGILGYRLKRGI